MGHTQPQRRREMNENMVKSIRTLHANLTSAIRTMTAKEMALTPHRLGRLGDTATTGDGQKWVWVEYVWVAYN